MLSVVQNSCNTLSSGTFLLLSLFTSTPVLGDVTRCYLFRTSNEALVPSRSQGRSGADAVSPAMARALPV